jgi:hypothetical protein
MRQLVALLLALLVALCANAAPKEPYELVAFDYTELALETENAVRIQWSGTVESYLTYNGKCQVVITLTMESGEEHAFATAPFSVPGLGQIEISDEFVVPRHLWDDAVAIAVGALDSAATPTASQPSGADATAADALEECIRQTIADEDAFPYLRNEIISKKAEVATLETELMISSGLMRKEKAPKRTIRRQQAQMEKLEKELERLLGRLRKNMESYCRQR